MSNYPTIDEDDDDGKMWNVARTKLLLALKTKYDAAKKERMANGKCDNLRQSEPKEICKQMNEKQTVWTFTPNQVKNKLDSLQQR